MWVYDLASRALTRLTFGGWNYNPEWTPDGRRIVFAHADSVGRPPHLWWVTSDGSRRPELLLTAPGAAQLGGTVTPDSRTLVYRSGGYRRGGVQAPSDVSVAPLADPKAARTVLATGFAHLAPRVSPDGRWLAYASDESGTSEVYVRAFPGLGEKVQVSVGGGEGPLWSRGGRELFYYRRADQRLVAARVTTAPRFAVTARETILDIGRDGSGPHPQYDVTADGQRFVILRPSEAPRLVVVTNWFGELRARVGAARP